MSLNSLNFLVLFLPSVAFLFWRLSRLKKFPWELRWLLTASIGFYCFNSVTSLVVLLPSILIDYGIAQLLLRMDQSRHALRQALFVCGVIANVLFLGYFKFGGLVLETANETLGTSFNSTQSILPLGISFLVLQKIAFLADVRSGQVKQVPLLEYLTFTLFFPRTIAGPIVHYQELAPQFRRPAERDPLQHLAVGVCLISIGLFKKAFIADSLDRFVSPVFGGHGPADWVDSSPALVTSWIALLCYTLELYFDFSGYSDMALGTARLFGIRLPMNFNSPLKATSIVEFWSRWHITLTRFLTAYVYTPLVLHLTRRRLQNGTAVLKGKKSKLSAIGVIVALPTLTTMLMSGLWHGVGWQFIYWGLLHGAYLTVNQTWRMLRPRFWPDTASHERVMGPLGHLLTFLAVIFALVLFRAPTPSSAWSIYAGLLGANGIFPEFMRLYWVAGVGTPWAIMNMQVPLMALGWIAVLLPAVMLLPNSLDLLRRFQPALDCQSEREVAEKPTSKGGAGEKGVCVWLLRRIAMLRKLIETVEVRGLILSRWVAVVSALLCVLGMMALDRGGGFLYGQF